MVDEKQEEVKQEAPAENPLPNLTELYDKIKQENDRTEALLKRNEELVARKLLGGQTDAGVQPVEPKEETPEEYKKRIMGN